MKGVSFVQDTNGDKLAAFWSRFKAQITLQDKWCFCYSILFSLLTHFYIFTNPLFNHDSIYLSHRNEMTTSGRWLLGVVTYVLHSYYRTPWIIALWTMLFLAGSCIGIARILQIRTRPGIILSCAFLNTFPTVACTLAYNFTADAYFAALILAVFGAWCCLSKRWPLLITGGLLLSASMGIYQAYISVAAALLVLTLLLELLQSPQEWKAVFFKGVRCLLGLGLGFAFYLVFLRLACHLRGVELSTYRGINEMGHYTLSQIPRLIATTYREILEFFLAQGTMSFLTSAMVWAQRIIIVFGAAAFISLFIHRGVHRIWQAAVIGVLLLIVSPLAVNAMQILNTEDVPHILMIYSYALVFVFVIRLLELCTENPRWRMPRRFALLVCALLVFRFMSVSNIGYLHLQTAAQTTQAFANRIAMRIEEQPGYGDLAVYITGGYPYYFVQPRLEDRFPITDDMTGLRADAVIPAAYMLNAYLQEVLHVPVRVPYSDELERVKSSEAFQEMPSWPAEGSVAVVEDVIVVKLST